MANNVKFKAPALPIPPAQYNQSLYQRTFSILRLYFNQLDEYLRQDLGDTTINGDLTVTGGVTATTLTGTLQTAAQTNITSVGVLDGGSITSNFGNIAIGTSTINSGVVTITSSSTDADLIITTSESGATESPIVDLVRSSGSPADNDELGMLRFYGFNDRGFSSGGPEKTLYGSIYAEIADASDGSEDGRFVVETIQAGSTAQALVIDNAGVQVKTAPLTITSSDTNADLVISNSEASSADASPIIKLSRSHGSSGGNDGDEIGEIQFFGANDRGLSSGGPQQIQYATIYGEIVDSTAGTEDGSIKFGVANNGSIEDPIFSVFNYGIVMGTDNDLRLGQRGEIWFEGASSNSNETRLNVVDPTADRTILLPDADGTLVIQPNNGGVQFPAQSAAPSSPANGQVYYDTDDHKLKLYANGAWVDLN